MAYSDTDRRRFVLATVLTLVALPALWWANESTSTGAPSIAAAGVDVAAAGGQPATSAADSDAEAVAPVFLDGPSGVAGAGIAEIAVPAGPLIDRITTSATFRNSMPTASTCFVAGIPQGSEVTVVNLDNNRSVRCTTALAGSDGVDRLVLHTSAFSEIADVTDAPIPVEIRR